MARFEVLVIATELPNKSAYRGEISGIKLSPAIWGANEKPPRFAIIEWNGSAKGASEINKKLRYDFDRQKFVHIADGIEYDEKFDTFKKDKQYETGKFRTRLLAIDRTGIDPGNGDVCANLHAEFALPDHRMYWHKQFFKHRKLPGVKELIKAALFGWYVDAVDSWRALAVEDQKVILNSVPPEAQAWLLWITLNEIPQID